MDCAKAVDDVRSKAVATAAAVVVNRERRDSDVVGVIEGLCFWGVFLERSAVQGVFFVDPFFLFCFCGGVLRK